MELDDVSVVGVGQYMENHRITGRHALAVGDTQGEVVSPVDQV